MIKNLSYMSFAFIYANLCGYIFHFLLIRNIGVEKYGEFMVLYSFMLVLGNVANLFSVASVKEILQGNPYERLRYLRKIAIFLGFLVIFIGFFTSFYFTNFLKISQFTYLWIVFSVIALQFSLVIERAFLQAFEKFNILAFSILLEQSLRIIFLVLFLSYGIYAGLFSSFIGLLMALLFLIFKNGEIFGNIEKVSLKSIFQTSLFISPVSFFIYADDLFIRRIFDGYTAGLYASVSLLGKAFLWFILTFTSVFFPKFIKYKEKPTYLKFYLYRAIGIIFILFFVVEISILFIGKPIFITLFSEKFIPAYQFLPFYFVSVLPIGLSFIFISLFTATNYRFKIVYLHLIIYYFGFLILPLKNINQYMLYIFSINTILLIIYILLTIFVLKRLK